MKKEDCIFCKIAGGDIPSSTVYEDADFRAIMDISPANKGHVIIIPKDHFANVFEIPEDLAGKAFQIAKKIAKAEKELFNCDGVNILQNNGEAAGQTVPHFHLHLIPRFEGDGQTIGWNPGKPSGEELAALAQELRGAVQ